MVLKWCYKALLSVVPLLLILINGICGESVDYYEKLIREEIRKTTTYVFPKDATAYKPTNEGKPRNFGKFDYIVVGGGSAGAVVASRLSEVPHWNVLLLEAGEPENDFTNIPAMSPYTWFSNYNWWYPVIPQKTCCLGMMGVCPYPRGKALGGSSAINFLMYTRGHALDYDNWANQGNPGWSYADILPYYKKSEKSNIVGDLGYHGTVGELDVEYHKPLSNRAKAFINAHARKGWHVGDYNGKWPLSAGSTQFNVRNGKRVSSATAFLKPAWNRTNLFISTGSYVTRIVLGGKLKRARGVIFAKKNVEYYAKAKSEVIVSGGVVGSPHILMMSGIGPGEHLREFGIPVQVDLDVGKRMHDHPSFFNMFFKTPLIQPSFSLRENIAQFIRGEGPLTISASPQGISYHALDNSSSSIPDLEFVIMASNKDVGQQVFQKGEPANDDNFFNIVVMLLHPKTRGGIYLQSNDPYVLPVVDSKCLSDPHDEDIEMIYKGIQMVLELMETEAFQLLQPKLQPFKSCADYKYLSKAYWMCSIRLTAFNAYHGAGTCRMGPNPLEGDVVDHKLRVHGVPNLRVADASVVPVPLSAHMNAPAMMIGEKVADLIKNG